MLPVTADILQMIRKAGRPVSKKEIADKIGLSVSAVADHIGRLVEARLIVNSSIGSSNGGRKPRLYSFKKDAGYLISIDMDTTVAQVAITDFECAIVARSMCAFDIQESPDLVMNRIREAVVELLTTTGIDSTAVKGIGVGIPGPVEFSSGIPVSPSLMPGWDQYSIRQFWGKYYHCPCYIDNDVNHMVQGEYANGFIHEVENMMLIKVGCGIGTGIIVDGKLYRGSNGSAGDLGHFDVGGDTLCWCGNRGCLEAEAGGKAMAARARQLADSGRSEFLAGVLRSKGEITVADIATGIQRLDPICVELNRTSSAMIGRVVASIVNFFNPELILVSSAFNEFDDTLLASIRQEVYKRSLPLSTRHLQIKKSMLGNRAGLIGAAYTTIEQLILSSINNEEEANLIIG